MKRQVMIVIAIVLAGIGTISRIKAAALSSTMAQKRIISRERAMQEGFSTSSLRSRRAGPATAAAKRAAATGLESKAEAERKESKEEAVRRVSDAFKKELQAKVEGREKRIEELGICSICRELPTFTDVNPNVVPPCEKSAAIHTMCKKCMIDFRKSEPFSCPTCRQAYSDDAIEYIDYHLNKQPQPQRVGRFEMLRDDDFRRIGEDVIDYVNRVRGGLPRGRFLNVSYTHTEGARLIRVMEDSIPRAGFRWKPVALMGAACGLLGACKGAIINGIGKTTLCEGAGEGFFAALTVMSTLTVYRALQQALSRRR